MTHSPANTARFLKRAIPVLVALMFAGCASTRWPKQHGDLFSELSTGERVHILFSSKGCFHEYTYDFDFERGATTTVRITSPEGSPGHPRTLTLSPRDISGLDRLVRFYRTHSGGGCTTVDDIIIEHFRGGSGSSMPATATEHYRDASRGTHDLPGVTTLSSLAGR